jgi:hypothetical protein
MNSAPTMLATLEPLPEWLDFLIMTFAVLLAAIGSLIWFLTSRKKRKHRRRRRHYEKRPLNPTLAETGGLPPKREPNQPPPARL